jgi:uncharacterized protein (DUF433 family)
MCDIARKKNANSGGFFMGVGDGLPWLYVEELQQLPIRGRVSLRVWEVKSSPQTIRSGRSERGMRYPVELMLEYLVAGDTIEDVLREFPGLKRDDLLACLELARKMLAVRNRHLALRGYPKLLSGTPLEIQSARRS